MQATCDFLTSYTKEKQCSILHGSHTGHTIIQEGHIIHRSCLPPGVLSHCRCDVRLSGQTSNISDHFVSISEALERQSRQNFTLLSEVAHAHTIHLKYHNSFRTYLHPSAYNKIQSHPDVWKATPIHHIRAIRGLLNNRFSPKRLKDFFQNHIRAISTYLTAHFHQRVKSHLQLSHWHHKKDYAPNSH